MSITYFCKNCDFNLNTHLTGEKQNIQKRKKGHVEIYYSIYNVQDMLNRKAGRSYALYFPHVKNITWEYLILIQIVSKVYNIYVILAFLFKKALSTEESRRIYPKL